jgi:phosphohistidine phosphatase
MDLIFWRHAEAEDEREGLADVDRALTPRGEKQAARIGAWLHRHLPADTRVLCSPALRCQQTALRLGRGYVLCEDLAQGTRPADLLRATEWPSAPHPVLIVGHQPALGQALAQLLRLQDDRCTVLKGAAWWLRQRAQAGGSETIVWAVRSPDSD